MKKIFAFFFIFSLAISTAYAQDPEIWGRTELGGAVGDGTLFSLFGEDSSSFQTRLSFGQTTGDVPLGDLIQASNGKLYGMTSQGGLYNYGVIFSYNLTTNTYIDLYDFDNNTGGAPKGDLVEASDGKLYGVTPKGGAKNDGVIFSFDTLNNIYTDIHDFGNGTDGSIPTGNLIQATNGKLYGVTTNGGTNSLGVIFSYNIDSGKYNINYNSAEGDGPTSSFIQATDGLLYATDFGGGIYNYGSILSFNTSNDSVKTVYSFTTYGSEYPSQGVIQAKNGKLYGLLNEDQGMYSFDLKTSTFKLLHQFSFTDNPMGCLIQAGNGKFYGTVNSSNFQGYGMIFCYDTSSGFSYIYNFTGATGAYPWVQNLIEATNGKLYLMTTGGGAKGYGVIASLDTATNAYNDIYDFKPQYGGINDNFLKTNDGTLYAVSFYTNSSSSFVISYDTSNNTMVDLSNPGDSICQFPCGKLIQANNGLLYGMNNRGKTYGNGNIFSYDISTHVYTDLYDFGSNTGMLPEGSLIQANNGKLYGMTSYEGPSGFDNGSLFSYAISTSSLTVLHIFNDTTGAAPFGTLLEGNDGKLYGLTTGGGTNGEGVIFSFDTTTNTYTVLHNFELTNDGWEPYGSLTQVNDSMLYGTTFGGGSNYLGTIFSYDIKNKIYKSLYSFTNLTGAYPKGNLLLASDSMLYGTAEGGVNDSGVVFKFNPINHKLTVVHNFTGIDGRAPDIDLIEMNDLKATGILPTAKNYFSIYPNPSGNRFTIDNGQIAIKTIKIATILGQLVFANNFDTEMNKQNIDVSMLPDGLYFVMVTSDNQTITKKLLIQR